MSTHLREAWRSAITGTVSVYRGMEFYVEDAKTRAIFSDPTRLLAAISAQTLPLDFTGRTTSVEGQGVGVWWTLSYSEAKMYAGDGRKEWYGVVLTAEIEEAQIEEDGYEWQQAVRVKSGTPLNITQIEVNTDKGWVTLPGSHRAIANLIEGQFEPGQHVQIIHPEIGQEVGGVVNGHIMQTPLYMVSIDHTDYISMVHEDMMRVGSIDTNVRVEKVRDPIMGVRWAVVCDFHGVEGRYQTRAEAEAALPAHIEKDEKGEAWWLVQGSVDATGLARGFILMTGGDWSSDRLSFGQCVRASDAFRKYMAKWHPDVPVRVLTLADPDVSFIRDVYDPYDPRPYDDAAKAEMVHTVPEVMVDGQWWVIDFTARQFDRAESYPLILSDGEYRRRWNSIEVHGAREAATNWRALINGNEPFWKQHDFTIATQFRGRQRYYEVWVMGELYRHFDRLEEAKAAIEKDFGPLGWQQVSMPAEWAYHYYFGWTPEFTDPWVIYVADVT